MAEKLAPKEVETFEELLMSDNYSSGTNLSFGEEGHNKDTGIT
jgi:hypothetical protein